MSLNSVKVPTREQLGEIAAGTAACEEIYQDEATLAFMDINPANDGHCLVIPKEHFEKRVRYATF